MVGRVTFSDLHRTALKVYVSGSCNNSPFKSVPYELMLRIFAFCPPQTLVFAELVCRAWKYLLTNHECLWGRASSNAVPSGSCAKNESILDYLASINMRNGKVLKTINLREALGVASISLKAFSQDGALLIGLAKGRHEEKYTKCITLSSSSLQPQGSLSILTQFPTISSDGRYIVGEDFLNLSIWDRETLQEILHLPAPPTKGHSAFTPDNRFFACLEDMGNKLTYYELKTGQSTSHHFGGTGPMHTFTFSPDNQLIAACAHSGICYLFHRNTQIIHFQEDIGPGARAVFSDDSQRLCTWSDSKNAQLWSDQAGWKVKSLELSSCLTQSTFSPNGLFLAAVTMHNQLIFFNGETGDLLTTLASPPQISQRLCHVFFSSDSRRIVLSSENASLIMEFAPPVPNGVERSKFSI